MVGKSIQPILLLSSSFGFLCMRGMDHSVFTKILMAAAAYFFIQFGFTIPLLYFSTNILSKSSNQITYLESDEYINLLEKIFLLSACVVAVIYIFAVKANLNEIKENLQSNVGRNLVEGAKKPLSVRKTVSVIKYISPFSTSNIRSNASMFEAKMIKIKAFSVIFCLGVLSAIGKEAKNIFSLLKI